MLENNLHPDVAERPEDLVVYGGIGKAARNWQCYHTIVRELTALRDDETLLVQSGKPVATFETHELAPRVLIANSNLVPQWATWEHFRELDAAGLMMYGQMTAGSWIYIGSQGILQGTYETFAAAARKRFGGTLAGRLVVTAGLGGMGGAQPLAVTMLGGTALCIEVDLRRIERRIETGYLDERAADLDDALARLDRARRERRALSIGLAGNAAEILPELAPRATSRSTSSPTRRARTTRSTATSPPALTRRAGRRAAPLRPRRVPAPRRRERARARRARSARWRRRGAEAFDYGNALRGLAAVPRRRRRVLLPRASCPPTSGRSSARARARSAGSRCRAIPADIHATDRAILELFGDQEHIARWIALAGERVHFQGLPARICWLGYGERDRAGERFNEMVASGELRGPIVIGRDHLDAGSVASPERETEAMLDGSDAVADWPILNALLNTACGASWVSVHHGGGVGMGKSIHAGQVVVADGTPAGGRAHPPHAARRPGPGDRAPRRRRLPRGARGGAARRRAHADARSRAAHLMRP